MKKNDDLFRQMKNDIKYYKKIVKYYKYYNYRNRIVNGTFRFIGAVDILSPFVLSFAGLFFVFPTNHKPFVVNEYAVYANREIECNSSLEYKESINYDKGVNDTLQYLTAWAMNDDNNYEREVITYNSEFVDFDNLDDIFLLSKEDLENKYGIYNVDVIKDVVIDKDTYKEDIIRAVYTLMDEEHKRIVTEPWFINLIDTCFYLSCGFFVSFLLLFGKELFYRRISFVFDFLRSKFKMITNEEIEEIKKVLKINEENMNLLSDKGSYSSRVMDLISNDMFSDYKGLDLKDLIMDIEKHDLIYRSFLGLSDNITFGPEIEFEKVPVRNFNNYLKSIDASFNVEFDGSLTNGGEFNSLVMRDKEEDWRVLDLICSFLKLKNADMSHNAGGHIHVGAHVLGSNCDAWINFIKLYTAYENILYRFFYGDKMSGRKKILMYAPPIGDVLYNKLDSISGVSSVMDLMLFLPSNKYQGVSFWHVDYTHVDELKKGNTIEFRIPNASFEKVVWQNNINTCTKMLVASMFGNIDMDFLDFKLKNERFSSRSDFCLYQEINLKSVLEFVDMVFDNNLDKFYFMRQYLKDFSSSYRNHGYLKVKKFFK